MNLTNLPFHIIRVFQIVTLTLFFNIVQYDRGCNKVDYLTGWQVV